MRRAPVWVGFYGQEEGQVEGGSHAVACVPMETTSQGRHGTESAAICTETDTADLT